MQYSNAINSWMDGICIVRYHIMIWGVLHGGVTENPSYDYLDQMYSAPHSQTYSFLPCYQTYNSKLISKKFPKKLRASLSDLQLRTGNFYRFLEISIGRYPDLQGNFFRF